MSRKPRIKISVEQVKKMMEHCCSGVYAVKVTDLAKALGYSCPTVFSFAGKVRNVTMGDLYLESDKEQLRNYQSATRQIKKIITETALKEGWAVETYSRGKGKTYRFFSDEAKAKKNAIEANVQKYKDILVSLGLGDLQVTEYGVKIPLKDVKHLIPYLAIFAKCRDVAKKDAN